MTLVRIDLCQSSHCRLNPTSHTGKSCEDHSPIQGTAEVTTAEEPISIQSSRTSMSMSPSSFRDFSALTPSVYSSDASVPVSNNDLSMNATSQTPYIHQLDSTIATTEASSLATECQKDIHVVGRKLNRCPISIATPYFGGITLAPLLGIPKRSHSSGPSRSSRGNQYSASSSRPYVRLPSIAYVRQHIEHDVDASSSLLPACYTASITNVPSRIFTVTPPDRLPMGGELSIDSTSEKRRPHSNTPYNEEQIHFMQYYKDLHFEWKDILQRYLVYWPDRPGSVPKTDGCLNSRYYREQWIPRLNKFGDFLRDRDGRLIMKIGNVSKKDNDPDVMRWQSLYLNFLSKNPEQALAYVWVRAEDKDKARRTIAMRNSQPLYGSTWATKARKDDRPISEKAQDLCRPDDKKTLKDIENYRLENNMEPCRFPKGGSDVDPDLLDKSRSLDNPLSALNYDIYSSPLSGFRSPIDLRKRVTDEYADFSTSASHPSPVYKDAEPQGGRTKSETRKTHEMCELGDYDMLTSTLHHGML